jgi:DNA-directed RNA polymerase specialized sigma24 family protein
LQETVEEIMNKLNETQREMLILHLQGYDAAEISASLHRSETSVYRTLRIVRSLLVTDQNQLP